MKYAIYYECDGISQSVNVRSARERHTTIINLIKEHCNNICYSRIYKSGEYGKRVFMGV